MGDRDIPPGLAEALRFPLVEALLGRRSRRFFKGANIPEGPFAYRSRHESVPLTELERMMVLTAMAGSTGWHYLIMHNARYAPHLPNYAGSAVGRTFPSAAGFATAELFFTDDSGVYFMSTRDAPNLLVVGNEGEPDIAAWLEAHRGRIRKLADGRLSLPARFPHIEGHNHWVANRPGTLFAMPVADLAQYQLANLCYYLQNGYAVYDDVHGCEIEGLEPYQDLYDPDNLVPLSFVERYSLSEATTELVTMCYAGVLMLQAMGLGGWMYNGVNPYSILGASGDPEAPGLGFRYDEKPEWSLPNPTGLPGVFEAYCPPHYPDMRAAVEALARRKFGSGGPFHPETPGPWKDPANVRSSAQVHDERFKACVAHQAQYTLDRFGKFPGTIPSVLTFMYLQAHHLDLEFYDRFYREPAYLRTHARHMDQWH